VTRLRADVRRHTVSADLDLSMAPGQVTVLFGPSGAGKSTVLRAIAGLDRTRGGQIVFGEETWDDGRRHVVPARRRGVGLLFQDHALFPHLSVRANVGYGLRRTGRQERDRRVREALAMADAEHLADRDTVAGLSGGEAQRVALARALAPRPRLLLLDEPLSALDAPTRLRLRSELRHILTGLGIPALVVTHDRAEALALADQAVVLVDGTARQVGEVSSVFDRPGDATVARVVGVETALPGVVAQVDEGLAGVDVSRARLTAVVEEPLRAGDEVLVCIRAEDVSLHTSDSSTGSSPRNHLPATVTAVHAEGALVRVDLDAGVRITSIITRPSAVDLALAPGSRVTAVVKSTAIHLIRR